MENDEATRDTIPSFERPAVLLFEFDGERGGKIATQFRSEGFEVVDRSSALSESSFTNGASIPPPGLEFEAVYIGEGVSSAVREIIVSTFREANQFGPVLIVGGSDRSHETAPGAIYLPSEVDASTVLGLALANVSERAKIALGLHLPHVLRAPRKIPQN